MKKLIRGLANTVFSLITTCLIMVSPVAAMVYATEPATAVESFSIKEAPAVKHSYPEKTDPVLVYQTANSESSEGSSQTDLTGKK
ncbi:MAG: hypothetical protein H6Q72_2566 [Firmicutes bacterium]|nr:hypothetical protein [Bacillota bacterium]